MWLGTIGTMPASVELSESICIRDGQEKPAVSAPIGDFFGIAHGLIAKYDNELFQNRNPIVQLYHSMPFRQSAFITVTNESQTELWLWYDINYTKWINSPKMPCIFIHTGIGT